MNTDAPPPTVKELLSNEKPPTHRILVTSPVKASGPLVAKDVKPLPAFQKSPAFYSTESNRSVRSEFTQAKELKTSAFSGSPNDEMQRLAQNNGGPEKIKWRNYELDLTGGSLKNGRIAPEGLASLQAQPAAPVHAGQTLAPAAPQPG